MAKRKQSDTKAAAPKKPTPSTSALPIPSTTKKSFFKNKRARFEGTLEIESPAPKPIKKTPKSVKKVVKIIATPPAPKTFIVSVGSYERLLYGLSCSFTITGELKIEPIFSFPAHLSSLRSVSASLLSCADTGSERKVGGKYLVSGGVDEVIKVWDLKRRKEVGSLEGEASG